MSASKVKAGQVFVEIGADPRAFFSALNKINRQIGNLGRSMSGAGTKIAGMGAAALLPFGAAIRQGTAYQSTLLNIQASTGATASELDRIRAAGMQVSQALGVGPTEATQGFLELLKAGMSLEQVLGGAGQTALEFAKVGNMDVAAASVVMADAMKVFGVTADVAANTMSSAADASSTSIEEMTMAFSQSAAVAALANQSMGDLSAALAVLANNGVKGSDAGTSVKTMLMRLMAPADDAAVALEQVGLSAMSFRGADGQMKPMVEIIGTLNSALAGMDQAAKDDIFRRIFGQDAIRAAAILTATGVDGFNAMTDAMGNALPVSEKYKTLSAGLAGAMASVAAAMLRAAIAISEAVGPALMAIAGPIGEVIDGFTKFVVANQELVAGFAKAAVVVTGVGLGLMALGGTLTLLSSSVGGVLTAIGAIATVVGVVLSPIGLLVAGLASLVAFGPKIAASMQGMFGGVGGMIEGVSASIGGTFQSAVAGGMTVLGDLGTTASVTFDGIYAAIAEGDLSGAMDVLWAGLYAGWLRGVESLMNAVDPWISAFQNVFTDLGHYIYIAWDLMWTDIAGLTRTMGAAIYGAFESLVNPILQRWDDLTTALKTEWINLKALFTVSDSARQKLADEKTKLKDDAAARKKARESGTGVAARMAEAAATNAEEEQKRRERKAAIYQSADDIKAGREGENERRRGERRAATEAAEGAVAGKGRGKREARAQNQQFTDLLKSIESASSLSSLRELYDEFDTLSQNGRLTSGQMATLETALEDAQERVSKAGMGGAGSSPSEKAAAGAGAAGADAAQSKAEVAGTFSSTNLGGMGFGSSLGERQLKALETIASNTSNMEGPAYAQE
jgi:TP901 family phage tail tape measure protein